MVGVYCIRADLNNRRECRIDTGAGKRIGVILGVCGNLTVVPIASNFIIKEVLKSSTECENVGADDRDLRKMITSSPNYSGGSRIT
jgi:hypothetical protein